MTHHTRTTLARQRTQRCWWGHDAMSHRAAGCCQRAQQLQSEQRPAHRPCLGRRARLPKLHNDCTRSNHNARSPAMRQQTSQLLTTRRAAILQLDGTTKTGKRPHKSTNQPHQLSITQQASTSPPPAPLASQLHLHGTSLPHQCVADHPGFT